MTRANAQPIGVGSIYDRVLTELVAKMRDMNMDKVEVGCLRTIVLFNPGTCWFTSSIIFVQKNNFPSLLIITVFMKLFYVCNLTFSLHTNIIFCYFRRERFVELSSHRMFKRASLLSFRRLHQVDDSRGDWTLP